MTDIDIVRELLRRAILTLCAIPDPDFRFRAGPRTAWPVIVQDPNHAYGAAPPRFRRFHPTAADLSRYLDVLEWLIWFEKTAVNGRKTVSLFWGRTHGASWWELQQRCQTNRNQPARSRHTPANRINAMIRTIATRFKDDILLYRIDGLNELDNLAANHAYGRNCVESDLADLPFSPKAVISAVPEPLSAKDEARAHAELTKQFENNKMRAMDRKRARAAA